MRLHLIIASYNKELKLILQLSVYHDLLKIFDRRFFNLSSSDVLRHLAVCVPVPVDGGV